MNTIKMFFVAVALLAICAYLALPKRRAYYGVCIQDIIDDEYCYDDFDEYCYREYLRRNTPGSGWYTPAVCYRKFLKTQMEIFYGRY